MGALKRLALLALMVPAFAMADVRLAPVFGDHMVLQRGQPLRFWGSGTLGEALSLQFGGHTARTVVAADGRWSLTLPPMAAGGPHRLVLTGAGTQALDDVMVGDVWLLAGQSNMEWTLGQSDGGAEAAAAATDPLIRHVRVPKVVGLRPRDDIDAAPWRVASPQTAGDFSGVGWFFARRMRSERGVTVGLVNVSWGGTHIETWTSRDAALRDPGLADTVRALPDDGPGLARQRRQQMEATALQWQHGLPLLGAGDDSARPELDDAAWPQLDVGRQWEEQGLPGLDGDVWYRRHVTLTAAQAAGDAELQLGTIDDCDETFVNGRRVGGVCDWQHLRRYALPAGALREGDNVVAVRVTDTGGGGGFWGRRAPQLQTAAGTVPLAGAWRARVAVVSTPADTQANDAPTLVHNGLVHPLEGLKFAGVLWYQGESNVGDAQAYAGRFTRLIQDWRRRFAQPALPFLYVQLAAYLPLANNSLQTSPWAELRDAQRRALALPHTAMAVATDVGDADDIHPRNKRAVGERLAALAQGAPPSLRVAGVRVLGGRAQLRFHPAGALALRSGDAELRGFAVADDTGRFVPAQARIEGRRVVVWSDAAPRPTAVRYGWVDNPSEANLVDARGWPAVPFSVNVSR